MNSLIEKFNQSFFYIYFIVYLMAYLTQVVCVIFSSCDTKHLINFIMHSFIRKSLISICQSSFGLSMIYEDRDRLLLQWIPILHKCAYKQCCIARAAKCSIKPLSKIVTSIFSAVKMGLQKYHDSCCYRSCVNQMWILKNSEDLL